METKHEFQVAYGWNHKILTVPAGTGLLRARNLPEDSDDHPLYWVSTWEGMDADAESWFETYGAFVGPEQARE